MMDFLSLFFGKTDTSPSHHHHHNHHHHHIQGGGGFVGGVPCSGGNGEETGVIEMDVSRHGVSHDVGAAKRAAAATATAAKSASASDGVAVVLESSSLSSLSNRKRGRCPRRTIAGRNSTSGSSSRSNINMLSPSSTSSAAPVLVPLPDSDDRPSKRLRGVQGECVAVYHHCSDDTDKNGIAASSSDSSSPLLASGVVSTDTAMVKEQAEEKTNHRHPSSPLASLPEDVMAHCLSFLGGVQDRHALQCTSKQFRRISNSDEMLIGIQVGGDKQTGLNGIISEKDTPETASEALEPFARAGNLEAVYMLGIIKSYCQQDVEGGICLLKMASAQGFYRASYALGLVLRDSHPDEAVVYMKDAANAGFIPALQELLPARQMKAKYGEPKADELRLHLDPLCLNRLLSRHYVKSADLRGLNTSHCWNPLCGRWAFKATVNSNGQPATAVHPAPHPPRRHHHHHAMHLRRVVSRLGGVGGAAQPLSNSSSSSTISSSENINIINNNVNSSTAATTTSDNGSSGNSSPQQLDVRVSRMKMCSRCCRAKYCSKLCQVYDWRSGRHKMECQFL